MEELFASFQSVLNLDSSMLNERARNFTAKKGIHEEIF